MKLDAIDKKILGILQHNSNITNAQLAADIALSAAPTLERVRKLEQMGIIKSYHAILDHQKLGLGISVFILISLANHKKKDILSFVEKIKNIKEVSECHHITGSGDFLLKVYAADVAGYHQFLLNQLVDIEEIGTMQSMVVLDSLKHTPSLPIE
jgi:DNA-binding Lrp family transcriptional regulator